MRATPLVILPRHVPTLRPNLTLGSTKVICISKRANLWGHSQATSMAMRLGVHCEVSEYRLSVVPFVVDARGKSLSKLQIDTFQRLRAH